MESIENETHSTSTYVQGWGVTNDTPKSSTSWKFNSQRIEVFDVQHRKRIHSPSTYKDVESPKNHKRVSPYRTRTEVLLGPHPSIVFTEDGEIKLKEKTPGRMHLSKSESPPPYHSPFTDTPDDEDE